MLITPGYNFEPNEIPTRAKLSLMVSGLSVRGIDIAQIDGNLIGAKYTGDTECSLPSEGWLMRSPQGAMWVMTRNGRSQWWRGNWGGMEVNRFSVVSASLGQVGPNTRHTQWSAHPSGSAPSTSYSSIAFLVTAPLGNGRLMRGKCAHSMASCVIGRVILWGGVTIPVGQMGGYPKCQIYNMMGGTANDDTTGQPIPYSGNGTSLSAGCFMRTDACATTAYLRGLGWEYGPPMYWR